MALFRHPHEIETGRTSSVGTEVSPLPTCDYHADFQILGFSPIGAPVVPSLHTLDPNDPHAFSHLASAKREKQSWDEICKKAAKVVSFIDLAGHERSVIHFHGGRSVLMIHQIFEDDVVWAQWMCSGLRALDGGWKCGFDRDVKSKFTCFTKWLAHNCHNCRSTSGLL